MSTHFYKKVLSFSVLFFLFIVVGNQQMTQAKTWLGAEYSKNVDQPIVGHGIKITATIKNSNELFEDDLNFSVSIRNPKSGQSCELTDKNTKNDGVLTFLCNSTENAGGIEVELKPDDSNFFVSKTFRTDFYDADKYCSPMPAAPVITSITRQNDITADVNWTQSEPFAGSFTILHGTSPTSLSNRKNHTDLSNPRAVISPLDPQTTYYVQVESNTCGTQLKSQMYSYQPATGGFAPYSASTASPSPSPSVAPVTTPTPTASVAAVLETLPAVTPTPTLQHTATPPVVVETGIIDDTASQIRTNPLYIIAGIIALAVLSGLGFLSYRVVMKKRVALSADVKDDE